MRNSVTRTRDENEPRLVDGPNQESAWEIA